MTLIVVERVTPSVRGLLSLWMLELRAGVFLGTLSPRVREEVWGVVCGKKRLGACLMASRALNEQGFVGQTSGEGSRTVRDFDGLMLLGKPPVDESKVQTPRGDAVRIAAEAGVDVRTVVACLSGKKVRPVAGERIRLVAERLGIGVVTAVNRTAEVSGGDRS